MKPGDIVNWQGNMGMFVLLDIQRSGLIDRAFVVSLYADSIGAAIIEEAVGGALSLHSDPSETMKDHAAELLDEYRERLEEKTSWGKKGERQAFKKEGPAWVEQEAKDVGFEQEQARIRSEMLEDYKIQGTLPGVTPPPSSPPRCGPWGARIPEAVSSFPVLDLETPKGWSKFFEVSPSYYERPHLGGLIHHFLKDEVLYSSRTLEVCEEEGAHKKPIERFAVARASVALYKFANEQKSCSNVLVTYFKPSCAIDGHPKEEEDLFLDWCWYYMGPADSKNGNKEAAALFVQLSNRLQEALRCWAYMNDLIIKMEY